MARDHGVRPVAGSHFAYPGYGSQDNQRLSWVIGSVPIRTSKIWNEDIDASQIRTG